MNEWIWEGATSIGGIEQGTSSHGSLQGRNCQHHVTKVGGNLRRVKCLAHTHTAGIWRKQTLNPGLTLESRLPVVKPFSQSWQWWIMFTLPLTHQICFILPTLRRDGRADPKENSSHVQGCTISWEWRRNLKCFHSFNHRHSGGTHYRPGLGTQQWLVQTQSTD